MWLLVMFDLPTDTKELRKRYRRFRKTLLRNGFNMLQYSVYSICCESDAKADMIKLKISTEIPENGMVRLLMITDRQYMKTDCYYGKKLETPIKEKPQVACLF